MQHVYNNNNTMQIWSLNAINDQSESNILRRRAIKSVIFAFCIFVSKAVPYKIIYFMF